MVCTRVGALVGVVVVGTLVGVAVEGVDVVLTGLSEGL